MLVYPLAFLFRQGIELAVKHLIVFLSPHYGAGATPTLTHDLKSNWRTARDLIEKHAIDHSYRELSRQQLDGVEALIKDFSEFDPKSLVFRYPVDRSNSPYIGGLSRIDVAAFTRHMSVAMEWFESVLQWFESVLQWFESVLHGMPDDLVE